MGVRVFHDNLMNLFILDVWKPTVPPAETIQWIQRLNER